MKDYTAAVTELRDHYVALGVSKKTIRAQVKAEFDAKIQAEIDRRIAAEELSFAEHLAAVKERENLPVGVIQDQVLRTRSWSRWTEIRDRAEIPAEFVRAEDIRTERRLANAPFQWSDDYSILTVTKNSAGEEIRPVTFFMDTLMKDDKGRWTANTSRDEMGISPEEREVVKAGNVRGWREMIDAAIQDQIEKGNVNE